MVCADRVEANASKSLSNTKGEENQMFFGKNKTTVETATPGTAIQDEPESDVGGLERKRAELQSEQGVLQKDWDEITLEFEKLQAQVAASEGKTFPSSPLGIALGQARHSRSQLREALDKKIAEVENITKQIQAIQRAEPARLRREALEACLPFLFQFIDGLCEAGRHEAEYREYDGHIETPIPWELTLAGGEGIEIETLVSRWLSALKREGITVPGEISDNLRHLPPPATYYARIQTDAGYAGYAARCGARDTTAAVAQALHTGWRAGFLQRARGVR